MPRFICEDAEFYRHFELPEYKRSGPQQLRGVPASGDIITVKRLIPHNNIIEAGQRLLIKTIRPIPMPQYSASEAKEYDCDNVNDGWVCASCGQRLAWRDELCAICYHTRYEEARRIWTERERESIAEAMAGPVEIDASNRIVIRDEGQPLPERLTLDDIQQALGYPRINLQARDPGRTLKLRDVHKGALVKPTPEKPPEPITTRDFTRKKRKEGL